MSGRSQRSDKQKEHWDQVAGDYNKKIAAAKELLNKSANGSVPAYNNPYLIAYRLAKYIVTCQQNDRPLTETGLCVALGIDDTVMKGYASGDRNYLAVAGVKCRENESDIQIELDKYSVDEELQGVFNYLIGNHAGKYVDLSDRTAIALSEPLQKARQLVSLEREERLAKSGKVGDIFTMKAREGWQDTTERHEHVIDIKATQALEALKQLGYTKDE